MTVGIGTVLWTQPNESYRTYHDREDSWGQSYRLTITGETKTSWILSPSPGGYGEIKADKTTLITRKAKTKWESHLEERKLHLSKDAALASAITHKEARALAYKQSEWLRKLAESVASSVRYSTDEATLLELASRFGVAFEPKPEAGGAK